MNEPNNGSLVSESGVALASVLPRLRQDKVVTTTNPDTGCAQVDALLDCSASSIFAVLTDFENLPDHIYGLEEAFVHVQQGNRASVRYRMKLPFPLGRVAWTNVVTTSQRDDGTHCLEWVLVEGDLSQCRGRIQLSPIGENGNQTFARYEIHVEHKNRLPKKAQQLAIRWLMPKVIVRLCKRLEANAKEQASAA